MLNGAESLDSVHNAQRILIEDCGHHWMMIANVRGWSQRSSDWVIGCLACSTAVALPSYAVFVSNKTVFMLEQ